VSNERKASEKLYVFVFLYNFLKPGNLEVLEKISEKVGQRA